MIRKYRVFCWILALLILWPVMAFTQEPVNLSSISNASATEIELLRTQIALMQSYQEQFISIVQWSLGAVLAMALGLAAFNWYSNKLSYERDIHSLRQENKVLHAELLTNLKSESESTSKQLMSDLSSRQADIQTAVTRSLDEKLTKHSVQIADHKKEILNLKFDSVDRDAKEAVRDKRFAWGIYKYCRLLEVSVEQNSDSYQAGEIIDAIGTILDEPKTTLSAEDVTDAVETLRRLPKRYHTAAENLISRIKLAHK